MLNCRDWHCNLLCVPNCRDSIGSSAIVGDPRWAGAYGVEADFIARGHCAVEYIKIKDIEVLARLLNCCAQNERHWNLLQTAGHAGFKSVVACSRICMIRLSYLL
jgi:hypothetical protein